MQTDEDSLASALQARRNVFASSARNNQMNTPQNHSPFPNSNNNTTTSSNSNNSNNGRVIGSVNDNQLNALQANYPMNLQQQILHHQQQQQQQQQQYPSQFQHQQLQLQMQMLQQQQQQLFQQPMFQTQNFQPQPIAPVPTLQQQQQHLQKGQQQQQFQMQPQGTTASPTSWPGVQQQAGNHALAQEIGKAVALALASVNFSRINSEMQGSLAQPPILPMTPARNENAPRLTTAQQVQQNLLMQQYQKQQQQQHFQNQAKSRMEMFSTTQLQRQPAGPQMAGRSQPLLAPLTEPTSYMNDTTHDIHNPYPKHNTPMAAMPFPSVSFKHSPLSSKYPTPLQQSQQSVGQLPFLPDTSIDLSSQQIAGLEEMDASSSFDESFEMGGDADIVNGSRRNSTGNNRTRSTAFCPATENIEQQSGGRDSNTSGTLPVSGGVAFASGFHSDLDAELSSGSNQGQSKSRSSVVFSSGSRATKSASASRSTLPLSSIKLNSNASTSPAATPTPISKVKPAATSSSITTASRQSTLAANSTTSLADSPLQSPSGLLTSIIALILQHQQKFNDQPDFGRDEGGLPFEAVIRGLEDKYSAEVQAAESREGRGVWKTNVLDILQQSPAFIRHVSNRLDAKSGGNIIYYQINPEIQQRAAGIVGLGKNFATSSEEAGKKRTISENAISGTASKQRRIDAQEEPFIPDEIQFDNDSDEAYMVPGGGPSQYAEWAYDSNSEKQPSTSGKGIYEEIANANDVEDTNGGIDSRLQALTGRGRGNRGKSISSIVTQTPLRSLKKRKGTNEATAKKAVNLPARHLLNLPSAAPLPDGIAVPNVRVQEHSRNRVTIQPLPYAETTTQSSSTMAAGAFETAAGSSEIASGSESTRIVSTASFKGYTASQAQQAVASQPPPPKSALVRNPTLYEFPIGSETETASGVSQQDLANLATNMADSEALPISDLATLHVPAIFEEFNALNPHGPISTISSDTFPSVETTPSLPTSQTDNLPITRQQLIGALMAQDRRIKVQQAQLQYAATCVSDLDTALKKYREREEYLIKWILEREKKVRLSGGMVRTCWENGMRREEINAMRRQQDDGGQSTKQSVEREGIEIDEMWKWLNVLWKVVGVDDMEVPMDPEMEMEIKIREMKMNLSIQNEEVDDAWTVDEMEVERLLVGRGGSVEKDKEMETETENLKEKETEEGKGEDEEIDKEIEENKDVEDGEGEIEVESEVNNEETETETEIRGGDEECVTEMRQSQEPEPGVKNGSILNNAEQPDSTSAEIDELMEASTDEMGGR